MTGFYTYIHSRASDNKPFYVGKGKGRRAYNCANRNIHWHNTVEKHGLKIDIAAEWKTEKEAFQHEKFLILCFKDLKFPIVNQTDGGEGPSGVVRSKETRAKISKNSKSGHPDVRASISKGMKVFASSEVVRERLRAAQTGKRLSEECKAKMSAAHKARVNADTPAKFRALSALVTPEGRLSMKQKLTGLKREKVTCPHCGIAGAKNVMFRWHFDNCKGAA